MPFIFDSREDIFPMAFTVEGAATIVVSAYHEATSLFIRCRVKRAESNWPGPSKLLEDSLRHGPQAIQAQMKLGGDRFGNDFCMGDVVATNELTRIAMDVQLNILKPLYFALEDDSYSIGSSTTDASDSNRIRTLVVLGELCRRLAQKNTTTSSDLQLPNRQDGLIASPTSPASSSSLSPDTGRRMFTLAPEMVRKMSLNSAAPKTPPIDNRRMSEMAPEVVTLPLVQPKISRSNGARKNAALDDTSASPSYLPQLAWFRRKSKSGKGPDRILPVQEENSPASSSSPQPSSTDRIERTPSDSFRSYLSQNASFRRSNSGRISAVTEADSPIDDAFSTQGTDSDTTGTWMSGTSGTSGTGVSTLSTPSVRPPRSVLTTSPLLRMPKAENDYLGFCRGAVELQRGDEGAFKEHHEWAFGKVPFLMCGHCAFTGRISHSKVWEMEGMRFRWAFLAKSHVHQTKVSGNVHTYICMFCVFQGIEASVIQGNDTFLAHIAEHRADDFNDVLLEKTRCVNFRAVTDDEDFDINLNPLTEEETRYQKPSRLLPESFELPQPESPPLVELTAQSPVEAPTDPPEHKEPEISEPIPWPYFR